MLAKKIYVTNLEMFEIYNFQIINTESCEGKVPNISGNFIIWF